MAVHAEKCHATYNTVCETTESSNSRRCVQTGPTSNDTTEGDSAAKMTGSEAATVRGDSSDFTAGRWPVRVRCECLCNRIPSSLARDFSVACLLPTTTTTTRLTASTRHHNTKPSGLTTSHTYSTLAIQQSSDIHTATHSPHHALHRRRRNNIKYHGKQHRNIHKRSRCHK